MDLTGLDPSRSPESYVRDLTKAYHYGLFPDVRLNRETGTIEVPQPEGHRPVFTLPDLEDQQLRFFADNDQAPIARPVVKLALEQARESAKTAAKEAVNNMYANRGVLPDDIRTNVTIDFALYQSDPRAAILSSIREETEAAIGRGEARSFKDIARIYVAQQTKIEESLMRRIEGYG